MGSAGRAPRILPRGSSRVTADIWEARAIQAMSNGQAEEKSLNVADIMAQPGIYTREALYQLPPREDLITGLIPRRGLVLLAAWRGSNKSFLALDIAATLATGATTFRGRDVTTSGHVIYVAHEGVDGL